MSDEGAARDGVDALLGEWVRERPGTPIDGMALVTRLWRLARFAGARRRRAIAEAGADQATLDLLAVLRRAGEPYALSPGEIARRALVTAGAISQRVARAERDALVERSREPGSRYRTVRLLPAGHALVDRLVGDVVAADEDVLSSLDRAERAHLDRLLRRVLDDLERRPESVPRSQVGSE